MHERMCVHPFLSWLFTDIIIFWFMAEYQLTSLFHSVDSKKFKQKKSSWYEHMERDLSHTKKENGGKKHKDGERA